LLRAYIRIGQSLNGSGNLEQGLQYYRKSYPIAKKFSKDHYYYSTVLNNMADSFIQLHIPDSALPYIEEAVRIDYKVNDTNSLPSSICTLGETYLARKEYDIGRPFMRKSMYFSKKINDIETLAYAMGVMSESFYETRATDSSVAYAYRALHHSIPDYKLITLKAYESLYKNFVRTRQQDSAYKYLRLQIGIKDTLFSDEKLRNIQTLNFNEQLRQEELAAEQERLEQQRKTNIQYLFIAVGLMTFIVLFLILSHSVIANARMIKFFSITGLLLVFEFLNMVLHPFLDTITFHSPVLMLVSLVCLAFLLIPAHHKLEKWATEQLLQKNKKIRVAAAKKTLSKLETDELSLKIQENE
jgi:tetratricopeptide (TPR) repeat protein